MKNTKAKGIGIGLLVGVVVLGLAGGLSYFTKGFTDWSFADIDIPSIFPTDTTTSTSSGSDSTETEDPSVSLRLSAEHVELSAVGETSNLTATIAPANASDKRVTWASSDTTKVAITTSANTLTGGLATIRCEMIFDGDVTVTATTVDGGYSAACTVDYYEAVESLSVVASDLNTNFQADAFLYFNGSDYFARPWDPDHAYAEFVLDLIVSPASATLATSHARLVAESGWITSTSNFVSAPSKVTYLGAANSYAAGDIVYDLEEDTATIPIRLAANFSFVQGGDITFGLDGISGGFSVELYIAVTGVSVDPPVVTF
jgi:hypothetical protein